jgi:DNA polymerase
VADKRSRAGDGPRRLGDGAVGDAEDDRVSGGDLAAPGGAADLVSGPVQRGGQRPSDPAAADDADARRPRAGGLIEGAVGGLPFQFPHARYRSVGWIRVRSLAGSGLPKGYRPPGRAALRPSARLPKLAIVSDRSAAERREELIDLYRRVSRCHECPLAESRTNAVFGSGNADADLMFVGEAPGFHEDQQAKPFVGRAGALLEQLLGEIGLERDDVFITNVLKSRPPGNRDPQPMEIEACQPYLFKQIELIEPRVICTLGNFATKLLSGSGQGITRVHGRPQEREVGGLNVRLYPLFHPAAALRTEAVRTALRDDFGGLPALLEEPSPGSSDARPLALDGVRVATPPDAPAPAAPQLGLFG